MPFWYFFTIPRLPKQVSERSNTVEITEYLVKESNEIDIGMPIALVQNFWALMTLRARGYVGRYLMPAL